MATETEEASEESPKKGYTERVTESKKISKPEESMEEIIIVLERIIGKLIRIDISIVAIKNQYGVYSGKSQDVDYVFYGMGLLSEEITDMRYFISNVIDDLKKSEPISVLEINSKAVEVSSRIYFVYQLESALKRFLNSSLKDDKESIFDENEKIHIAVLRTRLFYDLDDLMELGKRLNVKDQAILQKNELFKQIADNSKKINAAFARSSGAIIVLAIIALVMFVWLRNSSLSHAYEEETVKNKALDSINNVYKRQIDNFNSVPMNISRK